MAKRSRNHAKQPRADSIPTANKIPRAIILPSESFRPELRADKMDVGGPWNWDAVNGTRLRDFLEKIFSVQKLSWKEIHDGDSHLVDVIKIIPSARKRLQEIGQDDLDQLYSLRLAGKLRVWCIKDNNILWLLWWDPQHSICPCEKKHT